MKSFIIAGPTASGKSDLALDLATRCGAGIFSADAFQIYRGLDIGTAKAPVPEQLAVPHHLLDLAHPGEKFSVADYLRRAAVAVDSAPPDRPRLWVGGTGLYIRALREGLSPAPESDPELLRELEQWDLVRLQVEVRKLDPQWSATADLQNPRRILRTLAVVKQTGRPLSDWHKEKAPALLAGVRGVVLNPDRDWLKRRIVARVAEMWDRDWVGEVRSLLKVAGWRDSQSARAIGYLDVVDHLDGLISAAECREKIILQTLQYAKRQDTWFRQEVGLEMIPVGEDTDWSGLGDRLLAEIIDS